MARARFVKPGLLERAAEAAASGEAARAERLYRQVLSAQFDNPTALYALSVLTSRRGEHRQALAFNERLLTCCPALPEAHYSRGTMMHQLGRFAEAVANFDRAVVLRPDFVEALQNRGVSLIALGRHDDALACFDRILELNPKHADAQFGRAQALHDVGRFTDALDGYDRLLSLDRANAVAWNNRGNTMRALNRLADALASFDAAIKIDAACAEAYANRANVLKDLDQFEAAIAGYDQALGIRSEQPGAWNNRGLALEELGRFEEALASFNQAVRFDPGHAEHRYNRATLQLLMGNFAEGWGEYEWRRRQKGWPQCTFVGREWKGEEITGRRLFVYGEQGLGDCIMAARFATSLVERGAEVLIGAPARLDALLNGLNCPGRVLPLGEKLPEFDLHLPLLSIPGKIGFDPDRVRVPVPYLAADPVLVERWSARLPESPVRVGIAWQGSHKSRASPLAAFAPLGRVPGIALISLQKGTGAEQVDQVKDALDITTLGDGFDAGPQAYLDTAAVMMSLDLVITIDTSVAHLAGALGRPVWIALEQLPDWRWLLARDDSPWYPTARLFRQPERGDWQSVFEKMAAELMRERYPRSTPRRP